MTVVALLAEGVDRNSNAACYFPVSHESPSSRRAWIEILARMSARCGNMVALLAEGVDRNSLYAGKLLFFIGRPPRGGRG